MTEHQEPYPGDEPPNDGERAEEETEADEPEFEAFASERLQEAECDKPSEDSG
jgi:hypothetical protein